jgi:uncharacterized membrane protein
MAAMPIGPRPGTKRPLPRVHGPAIVAHVTTESAAGGGMRDRLPPWARSLWHPGILLALLDGVGLAIAGYLSFVELRNEAPSCAIAKGCEIVANSPYSRINGIPVAVFGVLLSIALLVLALAWWRTNRPGLLLAHYSLSFVGVAFEGYFTYLELFVIGAVCMWCALYAVSLLLRFLLVVAVWMRRDRYAPEGDSPGR